MRYPLEADSLLPYAVYRAVEFAWDHAKHERPRRECGFDFDYAARIFAGTRGIISAWKASGKDTRTWRSSRE